MSDRIWGLSLVLSREGDGVVTWGVKNRMDVCIGGDSVLYLYQKTKLKTKNIRLWKQLIRFTIGLPLTMC